MARFFSLLARWCSGELWATGDFCRDDKGHGLGRPHVTEHWLDHVTYPPVAMALWAGLLGATPPHIRGPPPSALIRSFDRLVRLPCPREHGRWAVEGHHQMLV